MAMGKITFVKAELEHIAPVVKKLRYSDIQFVLKFCEDNVVNVIKDRIQNTIDPVCAMMDDEPVALFGVSEVSFLGICGYSWMIATDKMNEAKLEAAKKSRDYIRKKKKEYKEIIALIDAKDERSVRWHKWLGFRLIEDVKNGYKYFKGVLEGGY